MPVGFSSARGDEVIVIVGLPPSTIHVVTVKKGDKGFSVDRLLPPAPSSRRRAVFSASQSLRATFARPPPPLQRIHGFGVDIVTTPGDRPDEGAVPCLSPIRPSPIIPIFHGD